jgi:hypothetical protein
MPDRDLVQILAQYYLLLGEHLPLQLIPVRQPLRIRLFRLFGQQKEFWTNFVLMYV